MAPELQRMLMQLYEKLPGPQDMAPPGGAPIDALLPLAKYANPLGPTIMGMEAGQAVAPQVMAILQGLRSRAPAIAGGAPSVYDQFGEPVEPTYKTIMTDSGEIKQVRIDPESSYPPPGVDPTQWAMENPPPPGQRLPEAPDNQWELTEPQHELNGELIDAEQEAIMDREPRMYGNPDAQITPEDIARWDAALSAPTTTDVPKTQPEPKKTGPKATKPAVKQPPAAKLPKAKKVTEQLPWLVEGFGEYGKR